MKTVRQGILGAFTLLLIVVTPSFGVVDQAIEVQGTNLVLSWPSLGYEYYMIQYRPTLSADTPWVQLTNAYPANGTNRTAFFITAQALGGVGGYSVGTASGSPGSTDAMVAMAASASDFTDLMAVPANGCGEAVPLALYPPDFDTSNLIIFQPDDISLTFQDQAEDISLPDPESDPDPSDSGEGGGSGIGSSLPSTGFFRVWHIPDFPDAITHYTFDGPRFIPIDFKDYMDRVEDLAVLIDGQITPHAVFMPYPYDNPTNWGMGIDFDRFPNGNHHIQLRTTLRLNDVFGDDTLYLVLSNQTRTIAVDCQISFTNWDDLILSSNYTFRAGTKNPNTDWWIDIYDAWLNYVNTGSGHTSNGQIAWTWNLTDYLGNVRDASDTDPLFYSVTTFDLASAGSNEDGSTPAASQASMGNPVHAPQFPSVGQWLICWQDRFYLDAGPNYTGGDAYYQNAMSTLLSGPISYGVPVLGMPIAFGTNSYTQAMRDASWSNVLSRVMEPRFRNFYYFGHGGSLSIGADTHLFDASNYVTSGAILGGKGFLTSRSVADAIKFNKYRFVFLDGCYTANGNWPETFGINKQTNTLSFYTSTNNTAHTRPSAFVGWDTVVGGRTGWGTLEKYWLFRQYWMSSWSANFANDSGRLVRAFSTALSTSQWIPASQLWGHMKVYGYNDLKFKEYNNKNDWRWP